MWAVAPFVLEGSSMQPFVHFATLLYTPHKIDLLHTYYFNDLRQRLDDTTGTFHHQLSWKKLTGFGGPSRKWWNWTKQAKQRPCCLQVVIFCLDILMIFMELLCFFRVNFQIIGYFFCLPIPWKMPVMIRSYHSIFIFISIFEIKMCIEV